MFSSREEENLELVRTAEGCSDPENLIDVPDKAPLLPVTLEVKKNDRGEWIKREKDSAIGVGDLVRFRCATGKLVTLSESSSFSSDVSDSSSPSAAAPRSDGRTLDATAGDSNDEMHVVECQWKGEIPGEREQSAVWGNPMRCLSAEGKTRPRPGFNSTVTVKCEGCRVPGEWLGRITGESPYPVMVTGIYRAYPWTREGEGGIDEGDHEAAGFVDSKTSIGINDTISFECVRGGVLRLQSSLSQSGSAGLRGATCVNPGGEELGESEFDLNISDVKCGRSSAVVLLSSILLCSSSFRLHVFSRTSFACRFLPRPSGSGCVAVLI
uniref:Uncharacterized protein n=1 Tax=Chromera velia CCMP2878 TaxID=1169474 RepID=A0A0G4HU10_9ALVE|eukprot:Cvel_8571.t1-p1 / transcript=Cvel_8571.t1 / gene=Cvel_8571 / organism=Chromera_velia_CCMP2878 / gene_product=hypothetical protein / transcript_product=hypothetical protein / location=Cvel_scaffold475:75049-77243(+) / protein_length=324 / sequence_SO=supercontig / SO=protein_coding / is_pseudo=false